MKMKSIATIIVLLVCVTPIFLATTHNTEAERAALRANDIATLNNIMGWHAWYHSAFLTPLDIEKNCVKTPEFTSTAVGAQNANYWIGMDNIKEYFGAETPYERTKGQFQFHAITSGIIEIAEDRKTAKGVWYTPGAVGNAQNLQGMWERYGVDFVMENGEWKIWHLHIYTDFAYPMTGTGGGMGGPPPQGEEFGPESSGGTVIPLVTPQVTADVGYKELSADTYPYLIPRPPEPYKTFSETWSYGDPDEMAMFSGSYREWSEIKKEWGK